MRYGKGKIRKIISQEERNSLVFRQRAVIAVIAALLLVYLITSLWYLGHFQSKSWVNGIEVSGLSLKQARALLTEKGAEGYQIEISGPGGTSETISGEGLGLSIESAADVKKALKEQKSFGWIFENFKEKSYTVDLGMNYDNDVLHDRITELDMMDPETMVSPEDAYLTRDEDGSYMIVPEVVGTKLKETETRAAIAEAVGHCRKNIDVTAYQYLPEITSENENLNTRKDEWNSYMKASGLTYDVAENIIVFDGNRIGNLLNDDGVHVTLSLEKITDMVAEWKYDYDTYASSFKFTTATGREIWIQPYGNYGYEIDDETTPGEIYHRIIQGDTGTYDVPYYHKPPYHTNHGLGGNYVEVSVKDQHLWVWKDGEIVVDTEVVTGLPVYGRVTYYGCYAINLKQENAVLGDVAVEGYAEEVRYWVRFNGGEGLHDAPWRENFGGKIWLYDGSHGCVNVPEWVMDDVYNNTEVGEAVVVYGMNYDDSVYTKGNGEVNVDYYENYKEDGGS